MPKDAPNAYGHVPQESCSNAPPTVVKDIRINGMSSESYFLDQRLAAIQRLLEGISVRLGMMTREEAHKTSNQILKEAFTPTIRVYGESIVELGGKEYLVNAPEGVTIRERNGEGT